MRSALRLFPLLCLCLTIAACATRPQTGTAAARRTTLRVENLGFADMTIYAVQASQRIRLGLATGNTTTTLTIPPYLVGNAVLIRFLADPVGGSRTPVSDEIMVHPGDEVTLMIPPG
jgi:hypothetical protein